jgi:hypothetical protein
MGKRRNPQVYISKTQSGAYSAPIQYEQIPTADQICGLVIAEQQRRSLAKVLFEEAAKDVILEAAKSLF